MANDVGSEQLNIQDTFELFFEVKLIVVDAAFALIAAAEENAHTTANAVNVALLILLTFCFID